MTYIVTGGFGFIGSNLVRHLYHNVSKDILVIDYELRDYLSDLYIRYSPADDFYNRLDSYLTYNVEAVFHEGGVSSTVEEDHKLLLKRNVQDTLDLIYYCRDKNIPLSYASSASVYGNLAKEYWDLPNKPVKPISRYAKSKCVLDSVNYAILKGAKPPKQLQGLRYFNVYGPNEEHKNGQSSPFHSFKTQLKDTGKITLFKGSENYYRDFIHVKDLIKYKVELFSMGISGIFDMGTGSPMSFLDVAKKVCNDTGVSNYEDVIEYIDMPKKLIPQYQYYTKANMNWIADYNVDKI